MKKRKCMLKIITCFILIFILPGFKGSPKSSNKPLVVRKKIDAKINNTEKSKGHFMSKSRSQKHDLIPKSDISIIKSDNENDKLHAASSYMNNNIRPPYDPKGKIDPFTPLFTDKPEIDIGKLVPVDSGRTDKTGLEMVDLSQLKLTGIILYQSKNRGVVEDASGKGYFVSVGTHIGTDGGKVTNVLKDRILIEENLKDIYGKIHIKKRELNIIKSF